MIHGRCVRLRPHVASEQLTSARPARPRARRAGRAEVTVVPLLPPVPPLPLVPGPRVLVIGPSRQVHLYSRHHIDLQRVAGALCRS